MNTFTAHTKPGNFLLCCFFVFILNPVSAGTANNLFTHSDKDPHAKFAPQFDTNSTPAVGHKKINLNNQLLSSRPGDELEFETVSGKYYRVVFDRFNRGSRSTTWVGHLKDYGIQYRAMITINKNHIEGRISTPDGNMNIKTSNGQVILMDNTLEGLKDVPYGDDYIVPEVNEIPFTAPDQSYNGRQNKASPATAVSKINGNTIIDVLVLYNADFKSRNNNDPATRIDHLTATANLAYLDSQINMQIRIVGIEEINYSTELSNSDALKAITNSSSLARSIADIRNKTGADLVMFIRPYKQSTHGGCGLAHLNKYMSSHRVFGTVGDGRDIGGSNFYCADDVFAHELGHTMGLAHDKAHASTSGHHPYSYGAGFDDPIPKDNIPEGFGTIMSYTRPDVYNFSSPALTCKGYTCGDNIADNALSLKIDKNTLSAFRASVITPATQVSLDSVYYLLSN